MLSTKCVAQEYITVRGRAIKLLLAAEVTPDDAILVQAAESAMTRAEDVRT